jgi:hypothetical protein
MDRWAYVLQGTEAGTAPTVWKWEGWARHGNILLAPRRAMVGSDRVLELGNLAVLETLADAVFTSPNEVPAQ